MRKNVAMLTFGILLAGAVVLLVVGNRKAPPDSERLSISFQGYSNSPSGKTYALFAVTNHDSCDLQLWNGGGVEFAENVAVGSRFGGAPSTNGGQPDVEVFYSLVGSNLCRGKSYTMFTEVPAHNGRWRLTWMVMRRSLANRMVDLTSRIPLVPTYRNGTPDFFYLTTDWIP